MEAANSVRIIIIENELNVLDSNLDKAVYFLFHTKALRKGLNPLLLSTQGKLSDRLDPLGL